MMEAARTQHHIDYDWKRTGSPLRNTKIQHWRVKCAFLEAMASKTTSYELTGLRSVKQHETFVMMSCQTKQNLVVSREFMTAPRRLNSHFSNVTVLLYPHCPTQYHSSGVRQKSCFCKSSITSMRRWI